MSATELQTQMPHRGFTLKARARPALASLSTGFTKADLARAPMPAIGNLAGKEPEKKKMGFKDVMKKASQRAFRGGAAGFVAGVVQVRGETPLTSLRSDPLSFAAADLHERAVHRVARVRTARAPLPRALPT
jgi:hypothetical protein